MNSETELQDSRLKTSLQESKQLLSNTQAMQTTPPNSQQPTSQYPNAHHMSG